MQHSGRAAGRVQMCYSKHGEQVAHSADVEKAWQAWQKRNSFNGQVDKNAVEAGNVRNPW